MAAAPRLPRAITDKITEVVMLGTSPLQPTTTPLTTPDTFVAGRHEDFPVPAAQLKRGLIWRWPDVERLGFGYQPF